LNSAIFLRLPTTIQRVTYLLVQDQTPGEYKIHDVETSKDILNNSEIQALLDQAAVTVHSSNYAEGLQGIYINSHFRKEFTAYHCSASTPNRRLPWPVTKRDLGEINYDFLENKVAKYSANDELSLLQANDRHGKVLILFSAS